MDGESVNHSINELQEIWLEGKHGSMRCQVAAERRGLPILLLHGYGALIEHWRRVLPLLQQEHTPCAFDLYNFGASAHLDVPPRKEVWAEQAAQVITEVLQGPAVVVGHSMGGVVAAHLAHTHPHLVRALVLVNSAGLPIDRPTAPFEQHFVGLTLGMTNIPGITDVLAGVSSITASWSVYQGLLSSYFQKDKVTPDLVEAFSEPLRRPGGTQAYLAVSREFENYILDIKPGDVPIPTLLIWGREDYAMPPSMATTLKQQMFPQAEIHLIAETGHSPFDEEPEKFCAVLLPWLARL